MDKAMLGEIGMDNKRQRQSKTELILWEVYNIARSLDDSDLQKALSVINREINDRNKKTHNKERF